MATDPVAGHGGSCRDPTHERAAPRSNGLCPGHPIQLSGHNSTATGLTVRVTVLAGFAVLAVATLGLLLIATATPLWLVAIAVAGALALPAVRNTAVAR